MAMRVAAFTVALFLVLPLLSLVGGAYFNDVQIRYAYATPSHLYAAITFSNWDPGLYRAFWKVKEGFTVIAEGRTSEHNFTGGESYTWNIVVNITTTASSVRLAVAVERWDADHGWVLDTTKDHEEIGVVVHHLKENILYEENGNVQYWGFRTEHIYIPILADAPINIAHVSMMADGLPGYYNVTLTVVDLSNFTLGPISGDIPTVSNTFKTVYFDGSELDVDLNIPLEVGKLYGLNIVAYGISFEMTSGPTPEIINDDGVLWGHLYGFSFIGTVEGDLREDSAPPNPPQTGPISGVPSKDGIYFLQPSDGSTVSGIIFVSVYSSYGRPKLYIDGTYFGKIPPALSSTVFVTMIDTTQFPDGNHTLRAEAGGYNATIAVVFNNGVGGSGTLKARILAPLDGATVPMRFKLVFEVAWENLTEPTVTVYVDGSAVPSPLERSLPPNWAKEDRSMSYRYVMLVIIKTEGQHTVEVKAASGSVTASDQITVYAENRTAEGPKAVAYVTGSGWVVYTPPTAVVVYATSDSGPIYGQQEAVGKWFIPMPAAFSILDVSPTNITVVYSDGSETSAMPQFSLYGAVDWLENGDVHGIPAWLVVLFLAAIVVVAVRRWVL